VASILLFYMVVEQTSKHGAQNHMESFCWGYKCSSRCKNMSSGYFWPSIFSTTRNV